MEFSAERRTSIGRSLVKQLSRAIPLALLLAGFAASSAQATVSMCDVPVTMSDGTVLRANVYLPSTTGRFPTVLTATGYNKDAANPTGQDCSSSQGLPAMTRRSPKRASR